MRICLFGQHLRHHFNPHRPRRALDALDCRFNRGGVQIRHLLRGDLAHLLLGHLADFILVRRAGALGDTCGFLQQHGRRRRLGDEAEAAVCVMPNRRGANRATGKRILGFRASNRLRTELGFRTTGSRQQAKSRVREGWRPSDRNQRA
jgi:hypothetical protein